MEKTIIINKDALVTITINTGIIASLQKGLIYLTSERKEKELNQLQEIIDKQEFDKLEPWMEIILSLTFLIKEIETNAIKSGQTTEE
jgi:hypothetical protein